MGEIVRLKQQVLGDEYREGVTERRDRRRPAENPAASATRPSATAAAGATAATTKAAAVAVAVASAVAVDHDRRGAYTPDERIMALSQSTCGRKQTGQKLRFRKRLPAYWRWIRPGQP